MVARVRNLTSSSSTAEYFHEEGGYYTGTAGDREAARAKAAEHRRASEWYGQAAKALGLAGKTVSAAVFERLLQGHVPGTDIRLGRKRDGKHEHRPGFDITFSAPKSVSLAALLPTRKHPRGDRAVLRCHDEAVKATLEWIEETLLQTRGYDPETGRRPRVTGHGMAAALFRHVASRNLDPQLHTHAVVANMTRDAEGRWKSIEPTQLHRNAVLIGTYYRDQLARRLIRKGYSVLPAMAGRVQSFEIAGYDRRVRDAFSTRRKQMEAWMDERGWDHSQAASQIAALVTRKRKAEPLHAMLRTIWAARAQELEEVPVVHRSRNRVSLPSVPSALEIVGRAMEHLEERQSVFAAHQLEAHALGHSPGRHGLEAIRDAVAWMVRDEHLVEAPLRRADRSFVTDRALKAERTVISAMKAGMGRGAPLAGGEEVASRLADAGLTEGQEEAVRTILLSKDRIVGVQGRAGTGKTTMLAHARALAGKRLVVGLAPSAAAARVLERETDMPAWTLQWFLARCRAPGSSSGTGLGGGGPVVDRLRERFRGAVLVLDEASMVSTDQMRSLMRAAEALEVERLVLVGDRSQLRAVEAGQPFRLLQKAGMTTAVMDEILRQREPKLRAAVVAAQEGEPGEAVELLGSSVHEVPWDELGARAAEAWLALDAETRSRTLLVAPTHELRAEINAAVRDALAAEGALRGRALRIDRLVGLGMTRAEMADVRNYREGDTVLFNRDMVNYRVKRDEMLTVTGIDGDRVLLRHPDGRPRHVAPDRGRTRYRLEVYETQPIEIRAGDRIRWTRNDRRRELVNGERVEIEAITPSRVRFRLDDGRGLSLRHDDPQLRHVDHAWSSTVHGAQGSTADHVIAVLDSGHGALADQSTFYVEISRARESAVVLTDNCEQLVEVLEAHTGERATALEAVGEEIGPDLGAVRIPDKLPAWSPREDWTLLEKTARNEGTILFRVEGYDELIDRTQRLASLDTDLPAPIREVVDGLLAYDRGCRAGDGGASEFLGLLQAHDERRAALERKAGEQDRPVAALDDWPAWRDMSARLAANGKALLEDLGERAGEAGEWIADWLERLDPLLQLDEAVLRFEALHGEVHERAAAAGIAPLHAEGHDGLLELAHALAPQGVVPERLRVLVEEVIAGAEAGEARRADIIALRDETTALVAEHRQLEALAGKEPPPVLEAWPAWSKRVDASAGRWREMEDNPGIWQLHLNRLADETAAIAVAVERLDGLRACDDAWAGLAAARLTILDQARDEDRTPFYLEGYEAFLARAQAFAEREDLPDAAAELAARILAYDHGCREARAAIEGFLADERQHGKDWRALRDEAARLRREENDPNLSMAELAGYAPLSDRARTLRETGAAILAEDNARRYGPHLDNMEGARTRIERGLERLKRHELPDRFIEVTGRLADARAAAEARGVLPFHDGDYGKAIGEAEALVKEGVLERPARRRLGEVLEEQAVREAEWARVAALLEELSRLDQQGRRLKGEAERKGVPVSLFPASVRWREASRVVAEEARSALDDSELHGLGHWRSCPELRADIEAAAQRAQDGSLVPEADRERMREMARAETARLADPDTRCAFPRRWRRDRVLLAGDRLRLRRWRDGPVAEALVTDAGWSGARRKDDSVTLRWLDGPAAGGVETIPAGELAGCGVRLADWSDGRLRKAEHDRRRAVSSEAFPLDCRRDLVTGDLIRWAELLRLQGEDEDDRRYRPGNDLPDAVQFEGRLMVRTVEETAMQDRCLVEVLWRSDDGPLGERSMTIGRLTGLGCWRAPAGDEEQRRAVAREEYRTIAEERRLLHEWSRHMVMTMGRP